jgi:hypothetical protein
MGLLRLAVLGSPEVFHDGRCLTFALRKAQALLLYLAVEGGMHPRSKLAAFLWPDSDPHDGRSALRNALTLLRSLLADPDAAASQHSHLLSQQHSLGLFHVSTLSQLCMHYAEAGEWEAAYQYALKAIALRKRAEAALFPLDFYQQYETEALLRGGDERQARTAVHRLGERVGSNRRFRTPYLKSLAVLAAWDGHSEQAIGHLREAAGLAADLGLPGE